MQRPTCPHCRRPHATCLCRWVTPTPHACEVLILQHPLEEQHSKNSARLLHLSLPRSRVVVGEAFDAAALQALMPEPRYTVLLYPPTNRDGHVAPQRLDATWRKSRKMLHHSPALQGLPRLPLDDVPAPRYAIRKAHRPGQLSTLEATCAALAQLDGHAARWQPLLAAFDGFVAQQQKFMPN